jgi:type VI secretion system secreted protein VgrG
MAQATQATRHIAIETPLGEDVLLLRSFSAHEELSCLTEISLDLLSEDREINFNDIVGQNVTIRLELPEGGTRYWNGYISRFVQGLSTSHRFAEYQATMVPWLWFLTLTSDCRIFQEKTLPDIIKQVFDDVGFSDIEDRTSGGYRTWAYCVQYRETDFNFVSRLMEQEGIYYYFKHEHGKCTIVLCDSRSKHDPFAGYEEISFIPGTHSSAIQERIREWMVDKVIRPGRFAHTDYNFLKPSTSLMSHEEDPRTHAQAEYEIYDFPGEYAEKGEGDKYAKVRLEELARSHEVCSGRSDSRGICSGHLFTMTKHTRRDQNREYLVLSTTCHASAEDYETSGGQSGLWDCSFTAIPSAVQFRPMRTTPKPVINGTQTAVVTGPAGEEIYTDEHGRVKVQFHWDREGQYDENSSCWVRVSQNWAGKNWGAFFLPRIGQEVIVSFFEGDPDRPIVTGAVYNGTNKPPYPLPAKKTKSTMKSDSSLGGGGFNEIRFEDKKGEEQIFIHAEKNQDIRTENDCLEWVGNESHLIVKMDQLEHVEGDKHLTVKGNHNEKVHGTVSLETGMDMQEKVGIKHALDAGMEIHLKAGMNVILEAGMSITLKAGGGFVVVGPAGVTISGTPVLINSGGSAGSGSGSSPEAPKLPQEADKAEPGKKLELPPPPETLSPQATAFQQAARSGTPFCET